MKISKRRFMKSSRKQVITLKYYLIIIVTLLFILYIFLTILYHWNMRLLHLWKCFGWNVPIYCITVHWMHKQYFLTNSLIEKWNKERKIWSKYVRCWWWWWKAQNKQFYRVNVSWKIRIEFNLIMMWALNSHKR